MTVAEGRILDSLHGVQLQPEWPEANCYLVVHEYPIQLVRLKKGRNFAVRLEQSICLYNKTVVWQLYKRGSSAIFL